MKVFAFVRDKEMKMNCPICSVELKIADKKGIEIDYCPQCRGVWLDRGELDKIIERSSDVRRDPVVEREERMRKVPPYGHDPRTEYRDDDDNKYNRKKKRDHWLEDLFDF